MDSKYKSKCPRCGKERIVLNTWVENIKTYSGTSQLVHTHTGCPDPECQKKVEADIAAQRAQIENMLLEREKKNSK